MHTVPSLRGFSRALFTAACAVSVAAQLPAVVLVDPAVVTGTNAIDPAGAQTVDQVPAGATPQATLEALSTFGAIQDFTGWSIYPTANYIVFSDAGRPDVMCTYSNMTGSSPGGGTTSTNLSTSSGTAVQIDTGSTRASTMTMDFGSATYDGVSVTAFDSTVNAPTAVGFTICGLLNVTVNATVTFYGTDDTTVLSTQTISNATDPDAADGTVAGSDAYVGFQATGTGVSSAIGKVRISTNQLSYSGGGLGVDDIGYTSAGYYMTVSGAGLMNGSSWVNAFPFSQMGTVLNTTMQPGDTLFVGSGTYNGGISLSTSGTATAYKKIIGVDTGTGKPVFKGSGSWTRNYPTQGNEQIIYLGCTGGAGVNGCAYWEINNLSLRSAEYVIKCETISSGTDRNFLKFRNIDILNARYGMYLHKIDNLTVENCSVKQYTKHGFRLEEGCNTATFLNCTADLSNGDSTWWDYSESIPFGFLVNNGGVANSNITFDSCVAKNNLRNRQTDQDLAPTGNFPGPEDWDLDSDGILEPKDIDNSPTGNFPGPEDVDGNHNGSMDGYWNGDGFVSENNTSGLTLTNCISINNEDGGYDLKQASGSAITIQNCVSVQNSRGFRLWYQTASITNGVSIYGRNRGVGTTNGRASIWLQDATVTAGYFTAHGSNDSPVKEDGSGSITLTNSILSSEVSGSTFTSGSVSLGTGTITYQPGSDPLTSPDYVNPTPTWDGIGNNMDSTRYGLTKGWHD